MTNTKYNCIVCKEPISFFKGFYEATDCTKVCRDCYGKVPRYEVDELGKGRFFGGGFFNGENIMTHSFETKSEAMERVLQMIRALNWSEFAPIYDEIK